MLNGHEQSNDVFITYLFNFIYFSHIYLNLGLGMRFLTFLEPLMLAWLKLNRQDLTEVKKNKEA